MLAPLGRFGVPFWRPLDFEGVPKVSIYLINTKWEQECPRGGVENKWFVDWFLLPKWEAWNCKKEVFAIYLLQFKRFRWSRKLIENWDQNGINKSFTLKPWASKVAFFETCIDFAKIGFLMLFRSAKKRAEITQHSTFGRHRERYFGCHS